jgi:hypothetical protein
MTDDYPVLRLYAGTLLFGLAASGGALAQSAADPLSQALRDGSAALDLRYRYETVDEDGFDKRARASLLRSRLTLESGQLRGFSALFEVDNVSHIGVDDYDSTENGNVDYPVIADPEGTEINQAWLGYASGGVKATAGRQRIPLGNMRFIGSKPWRQNEQTYDGARLQWDVAANFAIDASYVGQVNRVFGPEDGSNPADWHGDSAFVRGEYRVAAGHRMIGFAYLLDVEEQAGYAAGKTVNNSSDTFGVEYRGAFAGFDLRASVATQRDAGRSELDYRAPYYVVEIGAPLGGVTLKAAWEVLGADNGVGFATPLANGHGYQGWADKFLSTPGDGVRDAWVSVDGKLGALALTARYHDFRAESSGPSFGSEVDLQAQWAISRRLTATAKAAFFDTDSPDRYPDTTKAWLVLQLKL